MWPRHRVSVPPGFETVVAGRIEDRRPLWVGTFDQIYFVSFSPVSYAIECEAVCKEGIVHKAKVAITLQLERGNLTEALKDAGDSTYREILCVSAKDIMARQSSDLVESVKSTIRTGIQAMGLFELLNAENARSRLDLRVKERCKEARLNGQVDHCEISVVQPSDVLLTQLAARAGAGLNPDGTVSYSRDDLGSVVEYFVEIKRQAELMKAPVEYAKAQAKAATVEAEKQFAKAIHDLKIDEEEQQARVNRRHEELSKEDAQRQMDAAERNARIKERSATLEATYKKQREADRAELEKLALEAEIERNTRRLTSEAEAVKKRLEIAELTDKEETGRRERKKLDMAVELEHEREHANIRATEIRERLSPLADLVAGLASIPPTNYSGVHTLIGGPNAESNNRDLVFKIIYGLLTDVAEALQGKEKARATGTVQ